MSASADTTLNNVSTWLTSIGLAEYVAVFEENHVGWEEFVELTGEDLKELGISSMGHRKKLLSAIKQLGGSTPGLDAAPVVHSTPVLEPAPVAVSFKALLAEAEPDPEPSERKPPSLPPLPATKAAPAEVAAERKPAVPLPPPAYKVIEAAAAAQAAAAALAAAPSTSAPTKKTGFWAKLLLRKFLLISVALHLLFGLGATYFIVQKIQGKRKVTFQGGPPSVNPSKRAIEHKVSMAQKKKTGGAPPQAKRIVSVGLAKVTLPDLPSVPTATTVVLGMKAGMGGAGFGSGMAFGSGMGSGMGGGGGGGGGRMSFFGFRGGGVGLVGTFYDFKRDERGVDTGVRALNRPLYTDILKGFTNGSSWTLPSRFKHFTSKSKLGAKGFFFPLMPDTDAGNAFQAPGTGPGMWLAHYSGSVTPNVSGRYRLVGWGDNVLIVAFKGKVMLEATDIGYLGIRREPAGAAFGKPIFAGDWFTATAGTSMKMDVMLGDEGGVFCAGLFVQKEGENFSPGREGIPNLPLFLGAPMGSAEKQLYSKYLGEKAFAGPIFTARGGGGGGLLDALKR